MAAKTLGTVYVWGTGTAPTSAVVTSSNITKSYGNVQTVLNKNGNEVSRHQDDVIESGTITMQYQSAFGPLAVGVTFTFNSVIYNITGIANSHTNNGFRETTYNVEKTQYVTPA